MSWNPTHVVVAVQRAKDLISKGKHGTNDTFVTIALGSNKFQTTIKDKTIDPEWYEECDVPLPDNYNESQLILQVFHRNNLGIDEFLGHLEIPLQNFDVYDAPRSIWYPLVCKPGQNKTKPRGELEIRLAFEVKKIKDLDTLSTASATSKRFKMSKKNLKSAASVLGKKIKGNKNEKTTDYIPDLTGLDAGALGFEDIAENYSAPAPAVSTGKKKVTSSDSLSLPPTSPVFKRNSSQRSKGYSPFGKRRSRADTETPPSSNASTEDIRQRGEDSEINDGSFVKTHRRGGSGSDMISGKPPKPNRRLLVSKPKSQSTFDVSSTGTEFDVSADKSALDDFNKPRTRASLSANLKADPTADAVESNRESVSSRSVHSNRRLSSVSSNKIPEQPVLIDDDSDDSLDNYTPSPIASVTVKKEEPTDLFSRVDAQMQKEEEEKFSLVRHDIQPGETIFTPVGNLTKGRPEAAATSTPIVEESNPSKPEHKVKPKSEMKTGKQAQVNVFDLLMASDEPEYNVDDTVPSAADSVVENQTENKDDNKNPFEENPDSLQNTSKNAQNPFGSPPMSPVLNPFENSGVSNPFEDSPTNHPGDANPFEEPKTLKESLNPFEGDQNTNTHSNPFEQTSTSKPDKNPFEDDEVSQPPKPSLKAGSASNSTPEQKATLNPFEEIDNTDNESGGFRRSGSSRFSGNARQKKKDKKANAPAPPKPKRSVLDSEAENTAQLNEKNNSTPDGASITSVSVLASDVKSVKPDVKADSSDSPKGRYKKDRKAPQVPSVEKVLMADQSNRSRSSSDHSFKLNVTDDEGQKARSSSHTGRIEQIVYNIDSPPVKADRLVLSKPERQPAIGAEAPATQLEPKHVCDAEVQVSPETQENVPSEFRNMSRHELIELIQKLRQQVRKKEDHVKDLEEYIDTLLLRVMSNDPNLLMSQSTCSKQANQRTKLR